ncbi:MAG: iron ABC transporter permease, partial [Methanospirillum sp.]|uniref:iron chelate uptake ABC transporter family permease subunit n=1 Tax=Methanospirillum sp. TaxID=45200 RepID=UPI00236E44B2
MHSVYLTEKYLSFIKKKWVCLIASLGFLLISIGIAVSVGSYNLPIIDVFSIIFKGIVNRTDSTTDLIIWNNRLPRITMAVAAGIGLGISGTVMQAILKNPLASPFTLGIAS